MVLLRSTLRRAPRREAVNRRMSKRLDDMYCLPGPGEHITSLRRVAFGDSRPRCPSQGAPQQDHRLWRRKSRRRGAPRRRAGHTCTLR
eukprot:3797151-Prymnesium_polylepis.1